MQCKFSSSRRRRLWVGVALLGAGCGAQAATPPAAHAPGDPWERLNRRGYAVEVVLDRRAVRPLAKVYRKLTPGPIGQGIHNLLVNLSEPRALINDLLQLRIKRAVVPAARLVVNSTVGLLGLIDVAKHFRLIHHDNGFGVTLGRYHVGAGPYTYIPLVGPNTVRDLVGYGVDIVTNPVHLLEYSSSPAVLGAQFGLTGMDTFVQTQPELDALLSGAVDPYATLRSAYLQHRQGEIAGEEGAVPIDLPAFDEPVATPQPAPSP
jgi:phospholipid-binding lipoprotein MlaA